MKYNFNGRNITIDDEYIAKNMRVLKITKEEAIQQYLEDEGFIDNPEQMALVEKTKDQRIFVDRKPSAKRKVTKKVDEDKFSIISALNDFLVQFEGMENVVVENDQKLITFDYNGNHFKLDLIKRRKSKNE